MEITIIGYQFNSSIHLADIGFESDSILTKSDQDINESVSLSDTPVQDLADASNTARILVVVLLSFYTACIGK